MSRRRVAGSAAPSVSHTESPEADGKSAVADQQTPNQSPISPSFDLPKHPCRICGIVYSSFENSARCYALDTVINREVKQHARTGASA